LGSTGIVVTGIGLGGSPLGASGPLDENDMTRNGIATAARAFDGPINFLDTSNNYGEGNSERRIGHAIADRGGLPAGFVLATKVDADPATGQFDGDRVRRSFEESLERLGVDRVPLLHLHDPEVHITVADAAAPGGAIEALLAIKSEGLVDAIGIAGGQVSEMTRYVETDAFDVLLTHNRLTLLDRSARPLVDAATERGMGVLNAAAFGGGILAREPRPDDRYAYGMGTASQVEAAGLMYEACARFGVPLSAAALRFAAEAPGVDAVLVGASRPDRIDAFLDLAETEIPDELWTELETLVPPPGEWIPD